MGTEPEGEKFEIVFGAPNEAEAALIRGLFESAGIPAKVLDVNLNAYAVSMAIAERGYRVAVPASRAREADEVLIENGFVDPELQEDIPSGARVCAKCLHSVLQEWDSCKKCGEPFDWSRFRREAPETARTKMLGLGIAILAAALVFAARFISHR
jgi:hypothetical protein